MLFRSVGFAEVSLVIDNTARRLDFDADDVKVTRRYYRSGDSEYLLNNATVRLKDVQMLFIECSCRNTVCDRKSGNGMVTAVRCSSDCLTTGWTGKSVSYTHLDVYKRQGPSGKDLDLCRDQTACGGPEQPQQEPHAPGRQYRHFGNILFAVG